MAKSLGDQLSAALTNITALIIKTASTSERTTLTEQQAQIAGDLQVFVDRTVDDSIDEYAAATTALDGANAEAVAAKADLDRIAATITKFADAVDKVSALAAKLAAA